MKIYQYYVYILTSCSRRPLYTGVTNHVQIRKLQHDNPGTESRSYTKQYGLDRLVYFERFQWIDYAIRREKQLKGWTRAKKIAIIEKMNPKWDDLSREWESPEQPQGPSTLRSQSLPPRSG